MIRILQYQGVSPISKAIRWQTRSIYSHSAVWVDGAVIESWHKGGVERHDSFRDVHTPGTVVDVYAFQPVIMDRLDWLRFIGFLDEQIGKRYDFRSVARFVSRSQPDRPNDRWFCSELIQAASEYAGAPLVNLPPYAVSPRDISASIGLGQVDQWTV